MEVLKMYKTRGLSNIIRYNNKQTDQQRSDDNRIELGDMLAFIDEETYQELYQSFTEKRNYRH